VDHIDKAKKLLAPHVFTHARLRRDGSRSVMEPMVPAAVAVELLVAFMKDADK
jgi:hypothetical protein